MNADIPPGWALATIPELIGPNGVFSDGDWVESEDQDPNGEVRLIQLADVGDGAYINKSNRFLTKARAKELDCTFLHDGDVLVARMPDPLGRACIFPGDKKASVTVVDVCVIRGEKDHLDHRWLMHFINSPAMRTQIHALQSGSTRKRISRGNLSTISLPVPPRPEQTRIVDKLEELLSDLDAGVAELKAAQSKMALHRQSLLKAAVEGALTADWRGARGESQETGAKLLQRILSERRTRWERKQLTKFAEQEKTPPKDWQTKYAQPVAPDISELPPLPKGWVWASVDQIGEIQLGRQRSPDKLTGTNPTKYIRAANITEQGVDFSDVLEMDFDAAERAKFSLREGDVLLTEASGSPEHVGRPVIWPSVDGEYCFQNTVLRFSSFVISPRYAFRMFQAAQKLGQFQKLAGGVGINHLSAGKLSRHVFPLPSLEEQDAIVRALDEAFASIEQQEKSALHGLELCATQRRNLLRAAFSGQLVPQDANDEPASALLERIRKENSVRTKPKRLHSIEKRVAVSQVGVDHIREWIKRRDYFTFDELRAEVPASYQILRDSLFELLAEHSPLIEQEFVPESGALQFRRIR